jgi:curved DNA-binding protein CbpA
MEPMRDHYRTLGLSPEATTEDVKRAFRDLAKRYHPDRNRSRQEWAGYHMKRVIDANRVLSNPERRSLYDSRYRAEKKTERLSRSSREPREDDLRAQAERILHDLLDSRPRQAIERYEKLVGNDGGFRLDHHLDLRDWVDCKFLIAEQYHRRGEYAKALALYETLRRSSNAQQRFAEFMGEVRDRLVRLYCRDLAPAAEPARAAEYYLRALEIEPARGRKAFIHKKIAECHLAAGDEESARRQLSIAFELKPDLKGTTKICQRLGYRRD